MTRQRARDAAYLMALLVLLLTIGIILARDPGTATSRTAEHVVVAH